MQSNTCSEKCKFWKKYKESCPFFIETSWVPHNGGQPQLIKDCAPKRSVLLQMETYNRLIAVQQEANIEREMQHATVHKLAEIVDLAGSGVIQVLKQKEVLNLLEE